MGCGCGPKIKNEKTKQKQKTFYPKLITYSFFFYFVIFILKNFISTYCSQEDKNLKYFDNIYFCVSLFESSELPYEVNIMIFILQTTYLCIVHYSVDPWTN